MEDWGRKWKIKPGPTLNESVFKLEKHRSGGFIHYSMEFEKGGEEAWWDCGLVQRGINHLTWAPQTQLPPWKDVPDIKDLYKDAIDAFLKRVAASTRRLSGEILPMARVAPSLGGIENGTVTPSQVTILLAKQAVKPRGKPAQDLLIVHIKSLGILVRAGGGPGGSDGTAHGDPG